MPRSISRWQGAARVTADGKDHELAEGQAIFIPGNIEHAVHAEAEARLFFAFAADRYQEVRCVYLDDDCGRERKMRPERIYGTRCYSDPRPGRHQAMPAELQIKLPWLVLCPRLGPEACSCADEVRHD